MKNWRELSERYLKSQKKRTLLTLVGIILSVALLCAAGIMGESFRNKLSDDIRHQYGNYHIGYNELSDEQVNKLKQNIKVDQVGYITEPYRIQLAGNQKLIIGVCNQAFLDMHYFQLSSGSLPEKDNEIALEQWILDNMKGKPAIGDTVKLDMSAVIPGPETTQSKNNKSDGNGNGGSNSNLGSNSSNAEKIGNIREFKLVGIFKNSSVTQYAGTSFGIVNAGTAESILASNSPKLVTFVLFKRNIPLQAAINQMTESIGAKKDQIDQNTAVLTIEAQSKNNSGNRAIIIVQVVLMAVIIISTVAVIYNTFHISVLERIHQFGVLRSIGTTPRQIRSMVLFESCILGLIGIPLGLASGILGVKTVIGLFSFQSTAFFGGMQIVIDLRTLILTAVIALATLLASAYGPATTAGRVSPIEAIMNVSKSRRPGLAKRRKHPLLTTVFRIEGTMAYENLKRNKKRFFVTIFSMSIGIVLFIFFTFFINLMFEATNIFNKDYAVDVPFSSEKPGYTQKDYDEIAGMNGVKTVYRVMQKDVGVLIAKKQITEEYSKAVNGQKEAMYQLGGEAFYKLQSSFYGYRGLELGLCKPDVVQGGIDAAKMNQENGVLVSQSVSLSGTVANASGLKPGDEITILVPGTTVADPVPVRLKVEGVLDRMPLSYAAGPDKYGIITTEEVLKKITGVSTYSRLDIELAGSADKTAIRNRLQDIVSSVQDGRFLDFSGSPGRVLANEIGIILYGLVTVISLIGALNIINTISTNLILRTREFGILRAVGITPGQTKRMIILEGIFYGLISSFYGSIAGCLLAWVFYSQMNMIQRMTWHLPWTAALEACAGAVIIGLAASAAPLRRISRMNVVESIRAEE